MLSLPFYLKTRLSKQRRVFRCTSKDGEKRRCTASLIELTDPSTDAAEFRIVQPDHSHAPRRRHANSREVYSIVRDRATSRFQEPCAVVREEAIRLVYPADEDRFLAPERLRIDQVIQRTRKLRYPEEPASLDVLVLEKEWLRIKCPEILIKDIKAHDLRALLITSCNQLEVLSSRRTLFVDGTFKASTI